MIFDVLANADRYSAMHSLFPRAFAFLRDTDLLALAPGRYPIEGDSLFAIVEEADGRSRADAKLECHRKYIDIQFVLRGMDEMGWSPLCTCREPVAGYSDKRDIEFFHDAPASWVAVPAGAFCVFFPEDAHAPLVGVAPIRKVVLKIAVGESGRE
ncbi:MAG: YhcH/YjgK/YiaL family protein [Methylophilaceae bacterium]|jgi:biofilm protein TabA|nr:YhcH/YjgK/YiaL family protein [Methylophilaceae bacterium]